MALQAIRQTAERRYDCTEPDRSEEACQHNSKHSTRWDGRFAMGQKVSRTRTHMEMEMLARKDGTPQWRLPDLLAWYLGTTVMLRYIKGSAPTSLVYNPACNIRDTAHHAHSHHADVFIVSHPRVV